MSVRALFGCATGLLLVGSLFTADSCPLVAQEPKVAPEVKPARPIAPLHRIAGEYETSNTEFVDPANDADDLKSKGSISCKLFAQGQAFSIAKRSQSKDGSWYDDLMVFQYDRSAEKLRATLFHPGAPQPRLIDVETQEDGSLILNYEPTVFGDRTIVTRETITPANGKVTWLVERKQPDGTFAKVREMVGTLKTIGSTKLAP